MVSRAHRHHHLLEDLAGRIEPISCREATRPTLSRGMTTTVVHLAVHSRKPASLARVVSIHPMFNSLRRDIHRVSTNRPQPRTRPTQPVLRLRGWVGRFSSRGRYVDGGPKEVQTGVDPRCFVIFRWHPPDSRLTLVLCCLCPRGGMSDRYPRPRVWEDQRRDVHRLPGLRRRRGRRQASRGTSPSGWVGSGAVR